MGDSRGGLVRACWDGSCEIKGGEGREGGGWEGGREEGWLVAESGDSEVGLEA